MMIRNHIDSMTNLRKGNLKTHILKCIVPTLHWHKVTKTEFDGSLFGLTFFTTYFLWWKLGVFFPGYEGCELTWEIVSTWNSSLPLLSIVSQAPLLEISSQIPLLSVRSSLSPSSSLGLYSLPIPKHNLEFHISLFEPQKLRYGFPCTVIQVGIFNHSYPDAILVVIPESCIHGAVIWKRGWGRGGYCMPHFTDMAGKRWVFVIDGFKRCAY